MQNDARLRSVTQVSGSLLVDIPTGWEPQRNLVVRALRVAFADFSTTPWQGFEKSERGPNNSSLFQPLAAVVVVAVQVLLSAPNNENPNFFPIGEGFGFFVFFGNDNSGSFQTAVCPKPYQKRRITKVTTVKVP